MDAIAESLMRSTQFRGPVPNEPEVRRLAGELLQAMQQGVLTANDLRALADCLETGVRKGGRVRTA